MPDPDPDQPTAAGRARGKAGARGGSRLPGPQAEEAAGNDADGNDADGAGEPGGSPPADLERLRRTLQRKFH